MIMDRLLFILPASECVSTQVEVEVKWLVEVEDCWHLGYGCSIGGLLGHTVLSALIEKRVWLQLTIFLLQQSKSIDLRPCRTLIGDRVVPARKSLSIRLLFKRLLFTLSCYFRSICSLTFSDHSLHLSSCSVCLSVTHVGTMYQ